MRKLLFLLVVLVLTACAKTPLLDASEAMVGTWIHYNSETDAHRIIIKEDGTGSMEWIADGEVSRATKIREWYLDDNILSFGKAAFNGESYEIDKYPTFTWDEIINYYDTIQEATRYIKLDNYYYAEE
ncbi:MAG: hypothetical protein GQ574_15445 [Crocinitomix sp.]|nr:hypothetical protein [Crocinitomix sp.]